MDISQAQEIVILRLFDAGWSLGHEKVDIQIVVNERIRRRNAQGFQRKLSMAIATRNQQMPQRIRHNREDRASAGYVTHSDITQHVQAQAKDLCVTSECASSRTSGNELRFRTAANVLMIA
jgi:hypothetical protein